MLSPILKLLFTDKKEVVVKPAMSFSIEGLKNLVDYFKYYYNELIAREGAIYALGTVCIIIIVSIFFKNMFTYLSYRVLAPMRNYVMTKLRSDLYAKILELPIGFFTEQKKGDIISRMSNDANEIEWSVMSTLEGLIRDPLNILIILGVLVYISPLLSLFLLVLLPLTGFLIGRMSRSLKKQSTAFFFY